MTTLGAFLLTAALAVGQNDPQAAAGRMPQRVWKTLEENFVGSWSTKEMFDGKTKPGTVTARWGRGEQTVIYDEVVSDGDARFYATGVLGWDAKNQAVLHFVIAPRGHAEFRWTELGEDQWKGNGTGVWDGKEWKSPVTMEWKKDRYRYEDTTEGKPFVIVGERTPR